jgi:hypothetical protein
MNSRNRIKEIIRNSTKADKNDAGNDVFEPDWNELRAKHLNREREKELKRRKLVRIVGTAAAVIIMTFIALIFLTSIDEIRAGNFNIYDALRELMN